MLSKPPAFPPEMSSLTAFDVGFFWLLLFCQFVSLLYESMHSSAKWQRIPPLPYVLFEDSALFPLLVTLPFSWCHAGATEKQLRLLTVFTPLVVLVASLVSSFLLHLFQTELSWSILLLFCSLLSLYSSVTCFISSVILLDFSFYVKCLQYGQTVDSFKALMKFFLLTDNSWIRLICSVLLLPFCNL